MLTVSLDVINTKYSDYIRLITTIYVNYNLIMSNCDDLVIIVIFKAFTAFDCERSEQLPATRGSTLRK